MVILPDLVRMATSTAFRVSYVLLVASYFLLAPHCTTTKQRSWVLTILSSAAMSLSSLPLVAQYVAAGGQLKHVAIPLVVTDSVGRFFQAYLITDLTMGILFYRSRVNVLTGWIHHSVYIFIVEYAIRTHTSFVFCLCAVMEIPTFVLALGSITPRLRSDLFFAACFLVTRILFHVALSVSLVFQRHDVSNGSLGPAIIMACIFPLHAFWFVGCIKGFLRRAGSARKRVPGTKPHVNTTVLSEQPIVPSTSGPVSLHTPRASLARRRTALRVAVRARWDQLKLWKASGRLSEMHRRVRAAIPGRERVYQYVGLESRQSSVSSLSSEPGLEFVREDVSSPIS